MVHCVVLPVWIRSYCVKTETSDTFFNFTLLCRKYSWHRQELKTCLTVMCVFLFNLIMEFPVGSVFRTLTWNLGDEIYFRALEGIFV